jgi:LysR family glycine cleavage system transcriptional activator
MKRLPPLNALRAFEAAARHLSFSKAAQELNVTPGAVSQQIKLLEEQLETRLFERRNRQIVLTEAGQLCLPRLTEAFKLMQEAVETVAAQQLNEPLNITAAPAFVARWLIPRLKLFYQAHPEINVRIDASTRLVDLDHENIDVGIRFSQDHDPDLVSTHLMSLELIPVCSAEYLKSHPDLDNPSNLGRYNLLHYDNPQVEQAWPDWNMWLATVGIEGIDTSKGVFFNQTEMLIQAALDGQGVALVATIYARDDIRNGKLVQPFVLSMPSRFSYFLVTTPHKARRQRVQAFRQWMLGQCAPEQDA